LESPELSLDGLLVHEPREVPGGPVDRRIIVHSTSQTNVIVGFAVIALADRWRPDASVMVNDRVYQLGARPVLIPLRPSEVKLGASHFLTVRCGFTVALSSIDPFVVPAATLEIPDTPTEQHSLLEYHLPTWRPSGAVVKLFEKVADSATIELDELFVDVAKCIYQNVEFCEYFRAMAVRSAEKDEKKAMELWARAIRELLTEEVPIVNNRSAIWQDIALMPDDVRSDLAALVWVRKPHERSVESALCAFLA
jgi:hypothetical protein